MTQRATGCLDGTHGHVELMRRRPVQLDNGSHGLLSLWLCPVLRTLGAMWEQFHREPRDAVGGPLDRGPLA